MTNQVVLARTTRTAQTTGNWGTASNWNPAAVPASNQTNNTDDIVIDITGATGFYGSITLNGDLYVKTGTTLTIMGCDTLIVTGNATFANNSVIQVDPCAVFIIQGNLTNNNNSDQITVDGGLSVGGDFFGGNGSVIDGAGTVDITGTISGTGTITTIVLSVDLIDFNVEKRNDQIDISWVTASEHNNEKFVVERSRDALEWEEVISISGAGNSSKTIHYEEVDRFPYIGLSYYRLTLVDVSGKMFSYDPAPVYFSEETQMIRMLPNPVSSDHVRLMFNGFKNKEVSVVLTDINGRICFNKTLTIKSNNETQSFKMDHILPSGIYILTAYSEGSAYSQKAVIE